MKDSAVAMAMKCMTIDREDSNGQRNDNAMATKAMNGAMAVVMGGATAMAMKSATAMVMDSTTAAQQQQQQ